MKYLIDFTESTNRAKALDNLRKFGQQTTETEIAINTLFLISTDLDKNKLSDILFIPKGRILDNKKSHRGLAIIEILQENYITDTEDSLESLVGDVEKLKVPTETEKETDEVEAPAEPENTSYRSETSLNEKPKVKALARPIEVSPKGSYGFGTKFLDRFPLRQSKLKMEGQSQILPEEEYTDGVEVEEPEEYVEPTKPKVFSTDICKLDSRSTVPIWSNAIDPDDRVSLVEAYIRDLKRAKRLGLFVSDEILIFTSLVNSNKTQLYNELPTECTSSVEELAKYLNSAYGRTSIAKRQSLANLKQGAEESVYSYLSRVINMYYDSKNQQSPTLDVIQHDEVAKNDIIYYYNNGLRNPDVQSHLRMRLLNTPFLDLSKVTKEISDALDQRKSATVNLIPNPSVTEFNQTAVLEGKIDELKKQFAEVLNISQSNRFRGRSNSYNRNARSYSNYRRPRSQSRPRYDNKRFTKKYNTRHIYKCYACGKKGHFARDCRSKPKQAAKPRGKSHQTK